MERELPRPPWLHEEPQLLRLLGAVLDRFDKQSGEERTQLLRFSAESHLPALKRLDSEADQLWRFVESLAASGLLTIELNRKRSPYDAQWQGAKLAFYPVAEETLRDWLQRPREEPPLQQWRREVERQQHAFPYGIEALLKRRITIPGHSDSEVVAALARIATLTTPLTLRQLSALLFRGDSKQLDEREELISALFPAFPLKARPLVIAVHLPAQWHGVLFIENQDSYAVAVSGAWPAAKNMALVYAAGFRGSAERIREHGAALLHYCGNGDQPSFETWWFEQRPAYGPLHFFGDLDFSGMAILAALRSRFGDLTAWQPGYDRLMQALQQGKGHQPEEAEKQQQLDPGSTGCLYADNALLPAMRRMGFVDQELFN